METKLLDHGYVKFIESWGHGLAGVRAKALKDDFENEYYDHDNEVGIIEAARQSTQGAFRGWEQDAKLLKYLYEHSHMTPFEFAGMTIEVQAPIFVFREWHRHRTQSYNEMSARYESLPDLYYAPTLERVMRGGGHLTKQAGTAKGSTALTEDAAKNWIDALSDYEGLYHQAEWAYKKALEDGIPKELARLIMPVGHYSRMRATANLRNWLAFMTLRCDPAAQWEIQQYAEAVSTIIERTFPKVHKLWSEAFVLE